MRKGKVGVMIGKGVLFIFVFLVLSVGVFAFPIDASWDDTGGPYCEIYYGGYPGDSWSATGSGCSDMGSISNEAEDFCIAKGGTPNLIRDWWYSGSLTAGKEWECNIVTSLPPLDCSAPNEHYCEYTSGGAYYDVGLDQVKQSWEYQCVGLASHTVNNCPEGSSCENTPRNVVESQLDTLCTSWSYSSSPSHTPRYGDITYGNYRTVNGNNYYWDGIDEDACVICNTAPVCTDNSDPSNIRISSVTSTTATVTGNADADFATWVDFYQDLDGDGSYTDICSNPSQVGIRNFNGGSTAIPHSCDCGFPIRAVASDVDSCGNWNLPGNAWSPVDVLDRWACVVASNPQCGTANGQVYTSSPPLSNRCAVGTAQYTGSSNTGGYYNWNCVEGANSVSCSSIIDPVCGVNARSYSSGETNWAGSYSNDVNFCSRGTVINKPSFTSPHLNGGETKSWTCRSTAARSSSNQPCSASRGLTNSCASPVPGGTTNKNLVYNPTSANQPWSYGTSSCGWTCNSEFSPSGDSCVQTPQCGTASGGGSGSGGSYTPLENNLNGAICSSGSNPVSVSPGSVGASGINNNLLDFPREDTDIFYRCSNGVSTSSQCYIQILRNEITTCQGPEPSGSQFRTGLSNFDRYYTSGGNNYEYTPQSWTRITDGATPDACEWNCNTAGGYSWDGSTCSLAVPPPVCGSATIGTSNNAPTTNLCSTGSPTSVTFNGGQDRYEWYCNNNPNPSQFCFKNRPVACDNNGVVENSEQCDFGRIFPFGPTRNDGIYISETLSVYTAPSPIPYGGSFKTIYTCNDCTYGPSTTIEPQKCDDGMINGPEVCDYGTGLNTGSYYLPFSVSPGNTRYACSSTCLSEPAQTRCTNPLGLSGPGYIFGSEYKTGTTAQSWTYSGSTIAGVTQCSFRCNAGGGYSYNAGRCEIVAPPPGSCTGGTFGSNAVFCGVSPASGSLTNSLVNNCDGGACQYECNINSYRVGSSCVVYSCQGSDPANSVACGGIQQTGLTSNVVKSDAPSCNGLTKCQYRCDGSSTWDAGSSSCISNGCSGPIPDINSQLISGDNIGVFGSVTRTLVASDTGNKCEYTCNGPDWQFDGATNSCVQKSECGTANGVATITSPTSNLCAPGSYAVNSPFADTTNNKFTWQCQAGSQPALDCEAPFGAEAFCGNGNSDGGESCDFGSTGLCPFSWFCLGNRNDGSFASENSDPFSYTPFVDPVYDANGDGAESKMRYTCSDTSSCSLSAALVPAPRCGDGNLDPVEQCDFGDARNDDNTAAISMNPTPWQAFIPPVYNGPSLTAYYCNSACESREELVIPPACGDDIVNWPTEQCDNGDLQGNTCFSADGSNIFAGDDLGCYPKNSVDSSGTINECTFDFTQCYECSASDNTLCSEPGFEYLQNREFAASDSIYVCSNEVISNVEQGWRWRVVSNTDQVTAETIESRYGIEMIEFCQNPQIWGDPRLYSSLCAGSSGIYGVYSTETFVDTLNLPLKDYICSIESDGIDLTQYEDTSNPQVTSQTVDAIFYESLDSIGSNAYGNPQSMTGHKNGAIRFDGNNDYLVIPDSNNVDLGSTFTISFWANPQAGAQGWDTVLLKGLSTTHTNPFADYGIWRSGNNPSTWHIRIRGGTTDFKSNTIINGVWQMVTVTFDDASNKANLYVNGQLTDTKFVTSSPQGTTYPLYIGSNVEGNENFDGGLDEIRMYDTVLTPTQISALYNGDEPLVEIINTPDPTPTQSTGGVITVEAEEYRQGINSQSGGAYYDTTNGNTGGAYRSDSVDIGAYGGGYHIGWSRPDEFVQYDVNVPESGMYEVKIVSSAGNVLLGNTILTFSHSNGVSGQISTNRNGWETYSTYTVSNLDNSQPTQFELTQGQNTFKIFFNSGWTNVDKFTLEKVGELSGGSAPRAGIFVDGVDYYEACSGASPTSMTKTQFFSQLNTNQQAFVCSELVFWDSVEERDTYCDGLFGVLSIDEEIVKDFRAFTKITNSEISKFHNEYSEELCQYTTVRSDSLDSNCDTFQYFPISDSGLDYTRYLENGEEYNVPADPDAFDPICYAGVEGSISATELENSFADANISLLLDGKIYESLFAQEDGTFAIPSIPATEYKILIQKEGFNPFTRTFYTDYQQTFDLSGIQLTTGDCNADCTTEGNPNLCTTACDGINGCVIDPDAIDYIDNVPKGIHRYTDSGFDYEVLGCEGTPYGVSANPVQVSGVIHDDAKQIVILDSLVTKNSRSATMKIVLAE